MLELSRWQFAFTIIFHMTFPAITVGLAVFLAFVYGLYLRTHKPVYLQIYRFWKRIFAVGFALGVVAGAVITFELGLNWGPFANATGPVIAPIIGMEVVTAFFLEAGFIGVMLYGDGRVKERTIFVSTCLVALGTLLSTTWIMSANSWMQTPSGFTIVDGQFQPTSWREVIFSPSVVWRYPHMLVAVLISTAMLVGGIAAYYLIKRRVQDFARRTLSLSLGVLALLLPLQLDLGDHTTAYVIKYQPAKLEAFEGNWTSTNTGYNVLAIPDMDQQRNKLLITVPKLGSYFAKDLSGNTPTPGLLLTAKADRPNMAYVFWGFRVMFYASLLMFAAALMGVVLRLRRKLYSARWFHKLLVWLTPVGVLAIIGGWVVAETGRQPFVVYGHLRTSDAVSHLPSASLVFSLAGFVCIYLALLTTWIVYLVRSVRRGPELADVSDEPAPEAPTPPPAGLASVGSTTEGA
jgi:cytochrome d ubiquinol oxidase subunit I